MPRLYLGSYACVDFRCAVLDEAFDDGFTDATIGTGHEGDFVRNVVTHISSDKPLWAELQPQRLLIGEGVIGAIAPCNASTYALAEEVEHSDDYQNTAKHGGEAIPLVEFLVGVQL